MERDGEVLLLLPTECLLLRESVLPRRLVRTEKWIWAPPKSIRTQDRWPCRLAACTRTHAVLRIRHAPPPGYQNITATSRPGPRAHGPRASPPPEMSRSKRPLAAGRSPGRRSRWCRWTRGRRGTFASSRAAATRCRQPRRAGRHDRSHSTACAYTPVVPRACGAPPDVVWPEGGGGGCVHPLSWSHCLK